MNTNNASIAQNLEYVKSLLQNLIIGEDILTIAFGDNYDRLAASTILTAWQNGDFSGLPAIAMVSDSTLNGANGGYAISTNTIYLNENLIPPTPLSKGGSRGDQDLGAIATLVEEDEGAVFANLIISGRGERPFAPSAMKTTELQLI